MKFKLPIKTVSEANKHEHWRKSHKRHVLQKQAVKMLLTGKITPDDLPCTVKLTRIAPRRLDPHENLPMSQKHVLDAICELLVPNKAIGQADSDNRIQVKYEQMKGIPKEYAIEVEILKGG
jgi:hypothetical protein